MKRGQDLAVGRWMDDLLMDVQSVDGSTWSVLNYDACITFNQWPSTSKQWIYHFNGPWSISRESDDRQTDRNMNSTNLLSLYTLTHCTPPPSHWHHFQKYHKKLSLQSYSICSTAWKRDKLYHYHIASPLSFQFAQWLIKFKCNNFPILRVKLQKRVKWLFYEKIIYILVIKII